MNTVLADQIDKSPVIDAAEHDQLLADIDAVVRSAGIPQEYVWKSIKDYCGDEEIEYVAGIKRNEFPGMMYVGNIDGASVNQRMMAIAGACLRNYINAKVMTVQDVLDAMKNGDMPSPTVLLIPNFHVAKDSGGHIPDWQKSNLLGMLYKREQEGRQTVLYISDRKDMEADYGKPFVDHVKKFVLIN